MNKRAYSVWVSEIMLQQTQVATVIDYYNKWIEKWPTLEDLAKASLEEVNEMWSGLGYYSRGKRLHEGANKVVSGLGGQMPSTAEELMSQLPGVGKYTAGAVASIAFNQVTGLVDGNVSRVFARMRIISADITSQTAVDHLWKTAEQVVDSVRPGDFNQGLMELGATVCTPKAPSCSSCPVSHICKAYLQVERSKTLNARKLGKCVSTDDIEDMYCKKENCPLCAEKQVAENWDSSQGVLNYPRKAKKKAAREEKTAVCVISKGLGDQKKFFMVQRPDTGLLAGLWEFPSILLVPPNDNEKGSCEAIKNHLINSLSAKRETQVKFKGEVVHIFSHIHQTYVVSSVEISEDTADDLMSDSQPWKWLTRQEFMESAISTAMKKVLKFLDSCDHPSQFKGTKRKLEQVAADKIGKDGKKQLGMHAFFKPKS